MSSTAEWMKAYARQADKDFETWDSLRPSRTTPECHRLMFLQMACEKLCKAFLISTGSAPQDLQGSHGYIASPLPVAIRQELAVYGSTRGRVRSVLRDVRHICQEIELLNPSISRGGQRPDNCEYPWEDAVGRVHSPLDHSFHPSTLLVSPNGRFFLKLVRSAINRLL